MGQTINWDKVKPGDTIQVILSGRDVWGTVEYVDHEDQVVDFKDENGNPRFAEFDQVDTTF